MKDYYKILRVGRQARPEEIKRAYRRLAIVFHPDKNRSEESSSLFQEINEAHEVLSDPAKRGQYDQLLTGGFVSEGPMPGQRWHRDPAYRKRYQPGYRPPPPRPNEALLMMAHFLKYLRPISLVGVLYCSVLLFDYMLPFRVSEEKVMPELHRINNWKFRHMPNALVTDKGHQFPIPYSGLDYFPVNSTVKVFTSNLLNVLVKVEAQNQRFTIRHLDSIYQNFLWVPIILMISAVLGLVLKTGIEFRFNVGVLICFLLFFNSIFLVYSILS